jgi:hypothetical protein
MAAIYRRDLRELPSNAGSIRTGTNDVQLGDDDRTMGRCPVHLTGAAFKAALHIWLHRNGRFHDVPIAHGTTWNPTLRFLTSKQPPLPHPISTQALANNTSVQNLVSKSDRRLIGIEYSSLSRRRAMRSLASFNIPHRETQLFPENAQIVPSCNHQLPSFTFEFRRLPSSSCAVFETRRKQ